MANHQLPPLDAEKGCWDEQALNRRYFLKWGVMTTAGFVALTVGSIAGRFLAGKSFQANTEQWVVVGNTADLIPGPVHKVRYTYNTTDAWRRADRAGIVYLHSEDGVNYTALDATCTHLGCLVRWQEEDGRFLCPCHEGIFTREGEVVSGAPTEPLRRLATQVENGVLSVQL